MFQKEVKNRYESGKRNDTILSLWYILDMARFPEGVSLEVMRELFRRGYYADDAIAISNPPEQVQQVPIQEALDPLNPMAVGLRFWTETARANAEYWKNVGAAWQQLFRGWST